MKKIGQRALVVFIAWTFILGVLAVGIAPQARATFLAPTNSPDAWGYSAGTSTATLTARVPYVLGSEIAGSMQVGDLIVVGVMCTGTTTGISSITAAMSNPWTNAYEGTFPGTKPYTLSVWYTTSTSGTSATWGETITLFGSGAFCAGMYGSYNTNVAGFPTASTYAFIYSLSNSGLVTQTYNAPPGSLAVAFMGGNQTESEYQCLHGAGVTVSVNEHGSPFACSSDSAGNQFSGGTGVEPFLDSSYYYSSSAGPVHYSFLYNYAAAKALMQGVVLSFPVSAPGPIVNGQQTLGSCPSLTNKDTSTFTMVNSTVYYYAALSLPGSESFVNTTTWVAKVTSITTSQAVEIGLYVGTGPTVSAGAPLTLANSKTYTLTAGLKNQKLSFAAPTSIPPNVIWAIAVTGDSKINLNQSALSGLNSGSTGSPNVLPATVQTLNANVATIALCGYASYFVNQVVTSTVTSTSTSTVTSGSEGGIPINSTINYSISLFVVLFPGLIIAFVLAIATKNAPAAGIGFVAGMTAGAGLAWQAGLINPGIFFVLLILSLIIAVAVIIAGRGA